MGQSSSTQRESPNTGNPTHLTPPIERRSHPRYEDMNHRRAVEHNGDGGHSAGEMRAHDYNEGMTPDQSTERSDSWRQYMRSARPMRSIDEDGLEYEMPSREMRNAAFARMTARRQSTMSRLGSRLLPNSVIRGLLNSQEETPAEGHAHRHGLINRPAPRTETAHTTGRFSSFGSRGITRRRSTQATYFPRGEAAGIPDGPTNVPYRDPADQIPEPSRASWRRSVRLNRMRHSISSPISHIFGQPHPGLHPRESASIPELPFDERAMDTHMDLTEPPHELDSVEPAIHPADSLPSLGTGPTNPNLMRRLPGIIRARSSRVLRREEQTPLSRVLQLAAAAIAAQLSGTPGPALPNIQALGNDGIDGSLENFIQSLQHATSGQGNPAAPGDESSNTSNEAPAQPVNFLRVFRFANSEPPASPDIPGQSTSSTSSADDRSNDTMDVDDPREGEERTVTLVVVGVRSVPSANGGNGEQPSGPAPGLDALLGLPFLPPNAIPRPPGAPLGPAPPGDGQSRLQIPRQSDLPAPRAPTSPPIFARPPPPVAARRMSEPHPPLFESPPGPHPPPSTPAEHAVSTGSSGTSTPSQRPSSASALPYDLPEGFHSHHMQPTVEPTREPPAFNPVHQRRRSDSEFARHRALGSGSLRRNGMVEPDQPPPSGGGRSWLIYVVGTNLSANHPALTTPSLFTDNPTYEDMILLSSLLGPAKPPVASQTDINSAGGLFRLVEYGGSLVAEAVEGLGSLQMQDGERCLICLSDYEVAEEVRELNKCKHVFHKECIDQWLTTGRNSCPLCRGQGVHENAAPDSAPGPAVPDLGPTVV
ncbi:unnamed protein product [Penicillium olsonii]|uniref:RING-type domain-containing protein n=1 Tax=Penicillium olsonii TaxID=99116 RepID=A0A9W4MNC3_PENOL|nr:unnamed protein product [Penicillium olsonii]CAG8064001.1 unnamed protein product [Penicillium olsonii]